MNVYFCFCVIFFVVGPHLVVNSKVVDRDEAIKQLELGSKFLGKGQFSDALSYYHKAVELDPSNYQSFYRRATTYLAIGRPVLALADLEEVLKLKSDFSGARIQKANILLKTGDLAAAEIEFRDLVKLNSDSEIQKKLELVEHFQNLKENLEYSNCDEDILQEFLEVQIWNPTLYRTRAKCFEEKNELKKAVHDLKHVIKLTPDATDVMFDTAKILYRIGDMREALNTVRECLRFDPDHKGCYPFYKSVKKTVKFLDSMQSSIDRQEWEKCLATGQKASSSSRDPEVVINVLKLTCKCNRENGNTKEAIEECSRVIEEAEDGMVEALVERAEAYIADDDLDSAISDYKTALESEPENEEVKKGLEQAKRLKMNAGKRDYYKILGVKRTANKREITKAYRKLAQKWHPDNFQDAAEKKRAEKKFIDIASAKEVLTDEDNRRKFDSGIDPLDAESASRGGGSHGFHHGHGFNPFGGGGGQRGGGEFFFHF